MDLINWADLGWAGLALSLLIFNVVSIARGWMVPGPTARMWFEAWQTDRHTVERLSDGMEKLTEGQKTIATFIGEIKASGAHAVRDKQERSP